MSDPTPTEIVVMAPSTTVTPYHELLAAEMASTLGVQLGAYVDVEARAGAYIHHWKAEPLGHAPKTRWVYALTLRGDERHIFVPLPDRGMPADALALCGKLVRYQLRSQPWVEQIPMCATCRLREPR